MNSPMNPLNISNKIQSHHQSRMAIIYIRQSSLQQVERNNESTKLRYALVGIILIKADAAEIERIKSIKSKNRRFWLNQDRIKRVEDAGY